MTNKKYNKKEFDPKAAAIARKQEIDAMSEKIEKGVQAVFNGEAYEKLMKVMAAMPHYSINNQILIMLQNPNATLCNSFTGWKKHNRYVKSGEKGIRILAPSPYEIEREIIKRGLDGKIILDEDGEPVKDIIKVTVNAYKPVSTFDISQTDGEPLPKLGVDELIGSVEGYDTLMKAITEVSPVPIGFENIESTAKGYYDQKEFRIAIQEGMSEVQTVKTVLHELAHAKYHAIYASEFPFDMKTKAQKECEAESIAYICAAHYGIDTSDYSMGYLAGYSSCKEIPELMDSLQMIRDGALEIISAIDKKIHEFTYDVVQERRAPESAIMDNAEIERLSADSPFSDGDKSKPEKKDLKKMSLTKKLAEKKETIGLIKNSKSNENSRQEVI